MKWSYLDGWRPESSPPLAIYGMKRQSDGLTVELYPSGTLTARDSKGHMCGVPMVVFPIMQERLEQWRVKGWE